jgi:predicted RNA-binding protein with PIN domain
MATLIDGHNLIPHVNGLSLSALEDELQLIELLQKYCQVTHRVVEVYFDGAPAGQVGARRYGLVQAHFVRKGQTADRAIALRLQRLGKGAANWIVVSSDHQVQGEARASHATVCSSEDFAKQLWETQQKAKTATQASGMGGLSPDEVDEWLRLFEMRNPKKDSSNS